jgi:hypothetical protein
MIYLISLKPDLQALSMLGLVVVENPTPKRESKIALTLPNKPLLHRCRPWLHDELSILDFLLFDFFAILIPLLYF